MKTNKIKPTRIPRPLGTTLMARTLQSNPNNKISIIKQIKDHILNQYFINNQTINNQSITIEQICNYLQLPFNYVLKYMYNRLGYMQGFNDKDGGIDTEKVLRVLGFEAIKNSLNSVQIANKQALILGTEQGQNYVPFLTEQYNSAIRNLFTANADLRDLYRLFQGPKAPVHNSINYYDQKGKDPQSEALTPHTALILLDKERPTRLLTDDNLKANLGLEYNITELPEVRANFQQGIDADGQEIPSDDTTTATIVSSRKRKEKHRARREKELSFVDVDEIE